MAEFEVTVILEEDVDVEIDFRDYTLVKKEKLISDILYGRNHIFKNTTVIVEGNTMVDITPDYTY